MDFFRSPLQEPSRTADKDRIWIGLNKGVVMMSTRSALALLLVVCAGGANAASFDCAKASSYAEREICRDGYLSKVDEILSQNYKQALVAALDPSPLRQSQREWLIVRDQCTTQNCLDKALGQRIEVLKRYAQAEKTRAYDDQVRHEAEQRQFANAQREQQEAATAAAQVASDESRRQAAMAEHRTILSQPSSQPASYVTASNQVAPAPRASSAETAGSQSPLSAASQWFFHGPGWKYLLLSGGIFLCWAIARHHNGSATIYNDYTDALITNVLPLLGVAMAFVFHWLELPRMASMVSVGVGSVLAATYAIYATMKSNQGGLSIFLSIVAKLTLVSVFFAVILMLVASLFVSTRYKGESQARANARNRREKKSTMAAIAAISALYTALTAWVCRNPEFTSLEKCLAFSPAPRLA
jgi:uncharacterized protein